MLPLYKDFFALQNGFRTAENITFQYFYCFFYQSLSNFVSNVVLERELVIVVQTL